MSNVQFAPLTPVVKKLIIAICVCWFALQIILDKFVGLKISNWLILHPDQVVEKFWVWQTFTYMFFHSMSPFHILFNLMLLWSIGGELERHWGARFFTTYFIVCGVGAALVYCMGVAAYAAFTGVRTPMLIPVLGASGAIFGLIIAYGIVFSDRVMHMVMMFPMKAKHFAMVAFALDFAFLLSTGVAGGEVAYLAHLGGAIVGFLFLILHTRWKLTRTKSKIKKKTSSLRLVVDNEKPAGKNEDNPKYWN